MATVRRTDIFYYCNSRAAEKLHGLRNQTIYVTYNACISMSLEFRRECKNRNLKIEVIDNP